MPVVFPPFSPETPLTFSEPIASYSCQAEEIDLFAPTVRVIARHLNYCFVQEAEGIRVVDILRATERVIFDSLNQVDTKPAVQTLLIPIQMKITGKEKLFLCEHLDEINAKGISIRPFGNEVFLIDAIPSLLEPSEIPDLIYAYLAEEGFPRHLGKCLKRKEITSAQAAAIIEKLLRSENSTYAPDGKRIHCLLDENALGKWL